MLDLKNKTSAPGKIILSGEHAVVYGAPAVVMAINRFAETFVQQQDSDYISFHFVNFEHEESFSIKALRQLKHRLINKYQSFLEGECGIEDVLETPFELMQFAFISLLDRFNLKLTHGLKITTTSSIPIGCGMGSSAAVPLSVLHAVARYFKLDLHKEEFFKLGGEAESLQHGYSSKLDMRASLMGGCLFVHRGKIESIPPPQIPIFIVNTGVPTSSTGECVTQVLDNFGKDPIWDDFEDMALSMREILQQKNQFEDLKKVVRKNHRLLIKIGVVPKKVQDFIHALERSGSAGKICGAGSINGDNAGIVWIIAKNKKEIKDICERYNYKIDLLTPAIRGLSAIV